MRTSLSGLISTHMIVSIQFTGEFLATRTIFGRKMFTIHVHTRAFLTVSAEGFASTYTEVFMELTVSRSMRIDALVL